MAGNTIIQGMMFGSSKGVRYYQSGKVLEGTLAKNTNIDGINYYGLIQFYESGKVKEGYVNPSIIDNCKVIGLVLYYESGKLRSGRLFGSCTIQGIKYAAGTSINLFESGKVESGILAEPTFINGYKCRSYIWFYDSGQIRRTCLTQTEVEFYGIKFKPLNIYFYKSGKFRGGIPAQDVYVNGKKYESLYLKFDQNGQIITVPNQIANLDKYDPSEN